MKNQHLFFAAATWMMMLIWHPVHAQFAVTSESHDRIEFERTGVRPQHVNQIYQVSELIVHADIHNQVASVVVSQTLRNVSGRQVEIELMFPLPAAGGIQNFILMVDGTEIPGKLLNKDEARTIYEGIVKRKQDPALMEYAGNGLYRTSVFPVPAGGSRTISLKYTILCSQKGGNVQFIYPFGTQKFSSSRIGRIQFTANITADKEVRNIFSPSHPIVVDRRQSRQTTVSWSELNSLPMQDFKLYFTPSEQEVSVTMMSFMAPEEREGSFLMLINPSIKNSPQQRIAKDVIIAIDKSGSMSGQKMEQARKAAEFVLNNLTGNDRFNLVLYESSISNYQSSLIQATPEAIREAGQFVRGIQAGGGTNINEALIRSLSFTTESERPQYLIFLTDGMPTVGETAEERIASNCLRANKHNARIYSFGVGYDVNARLLDRLAAQNGGMVTYVKPGENLEVAVSEFYKGIQTPVLTDITIEFSTGQVTEIYPVNIPDFFEGSQIEIAGRYSKPGKTRVIVKGKSSGEVRKFEYEIVFSNAGENPEYSHIETIWATRKIGYLIDQIDLHGRNQELITSLTDLSKRYGILTPYTSFLAREDVNINDTQITIQQTTQQLRMLDEVSGVTAVNQRASKSMMKENSKSVAAGAAEYKDAAGTVQVASNVKNVSGRAFYYKNDQWVDGTLNDQDISNAKEVKQYSEAWFELSRQNNQEMNGLLTFDKEVVVRMNGEVYKIVQ
jgi:Ca-activated chloride channel homolog